MTISTRLTGTLLVTAALAGGCFEEEDSRVDGLEIQVDPGSFDENAQSCDPYLSECDDPDAGLSGEEPPPEPPVEQCDPYLEECAVAEPGEEFSPEPPVEACDPYFGVCETEEQEQDPIPEPHDECDPYLDGCTPVE